MKTAYKAVAQWVDNRIVTASTDYVTFVEVKFHDGTKHWMTIQAWRDMFEVIYKERGVMLFI